MQTTSCYALSIYTNPEFTPSPLTPDDLLTSMHLVLHATVRCQTVLELPRSKYFQREYPTWRRFIGTIEQYADRETQVITLFQRHLTL